MTITDAQIRFIESQLQSHGLRNRLLIEEMTDHIICIVETKIQDGVAFEDAVNDAIQHFGKGGMKRIQQFHFFIHLKKTIMKSVVFGVLCASMFLSYQVLIAHCPDPPSIYPIDPSHHITSAFGNRLHPIHKTHRFHKGIDFKAPIGTAVYASADGKVVKIGFGEQGYGRYIIIQHDETFSTLYAQLSSIRVKVDEHVTKGQTIGKVGTSGMATGPHLHYEVHQNGQAVDPRPFLGS